MSDTTTLPADVDAERSILGAVMWNSSLYDQAAAIIEAPDFYQPAHETVWLAISHLIEQGQPVDPITVANRLDNTGDLDRIGGKLELVHMLEEATPAASSIIAHARIVADHATRRRTIDATIRIRQLAEQRGTDPADILAQAQAAIDQLEPHRQQHATSSAADVITDMAASIGVVDYRGLPTPWPDLNKTIGGLQGSRLYTIGARPGVGKSLIAQNLAEHWTAVHQLPVLYASCEMPARELSLRMLAHQAKVHLTTLKEGKHLTRDDWQRINEAVERTADSHRLLEIADHSAQSLSSIRQAARAMAQRHGQLGLVVVDYLQLLTPPPGTRDRTREREVAQLSRGFKDLAMELDVPILLVSQLNRAIASRSDKRPSLTDLRESGAIEQDCDVVILMHQPDENTPADLDVIVAKNRDGAQGTCHLIQQGWHATIASAARH